MAKSFQYTFDQVGVDGRKFREISLPGGTFRMFEDRPNIWQSVLADGEKSIIDKIEDHYCSGNYNK